MDLPIVCHGDGEIRLSMKYERFEWLSRLELMGMRVIGDDRLPIRYVP